MARSISPFERFGKAVPATDATLQAHIFRAGDTLTALASNYYRDWRLWRVLADKNKITDVRQIETGTRILIPQQPLRDGRYESR